MRIYNISQENSLKNLWFDITLMAFITLIPFLACIFDFNFITFCILFVAVIVDILFFVNIYKKHKDFSSKISIHNFLNYVDFESQNIVVCVKSEDNTDKFVTYQYSQIEKVEIVIETFDSSATRKHYTGIRDIAIYFYMIDGEIHILHSYHLTFGGSLRTIYKIIDYAKKTQNLIYKLNGSGDKSEIIEKLDYYIANNKKLYVEPSGRKDLKILSIIIFLWGCAISIIVIMPLFGGSWTFLSCVISAFVGFLIYFPVILDKNS